MMNYPSIDLLCHNGQAFDVYAELRRRKELTVRKTFSFGMGLSDDWAPAGVFFKWG